ncbi:MAG: glycosyltransferase family 4 protein [Balneolaceae bacterium]
MKVLYISHSHPPVDQPLENIGGMQNVSIQLIEALKKRDDVTIDCIIQRASWKNIELKTFFFLIKLLWKIPAKVRSFKPDVIVFSSMVTAGVLPFLSKNMDVPCITINHGQDVTLPIKAYQSYLPRVFKKLSGVISVSSATKQACIERGMDPEIGVVLPNGFETEQGNHQLNKDEARKLIERKFNIDLKTSYLLLSVGRQVKRKGHQWFIENVIDKITHDVIFLAVGDGPENEAITKARNESRSKEKVVIVGRQPSEILDACYGAADLFIMPNIPVPGDMEGFGIVLLEANSHGVPAVASDLEGIKDVIKQGVNGYKIDCHNSESFAKKIDEIIATELKEISSSAKKYVMEHFGWDSVVSHYVSFFKDVANRN